MALCWWRAQAVLLAGICLGLLCAGLVAYAGNSPLRARAVLPDRYPLALTVDEATGDLFVSLTDTGRLAVLDGRTGRLERTVRVGAAPSAVAVGLGGRVLVANQDDDTLSVVDRRAGRALRATPLGLAPSPGVGLAISSSVLDRRRGLLYLTGGLGRVSMLDARDGTLLRSVGNLPSSVTELGGPLLWDGQRTLFLLQHGTPVSRGRLTLLDSGTLIPRAVLPVGLDADGLAIDPVAGRLFVTGPHAVEMRAARTGALLRQIPAVGTPMPAAVDPQRGRLFLVGMDGRQLLTLDSRSGRVLGRATLDWITAGPVVDTRRGRLYVPTVSGLAVLDAQSGQLRVVLAAPPGQIVAVDEARGRVFVLSVAGAEPLVLRWLPSWVPRWLPTLSPPDRATITIFDGAG